MLKEQSRQLMWRCMVADVLALIVAFETAYWLRSTVLASVLARWLPTPRMSAMTYDWMYGFILPIWIGLLFWAGLYDPRRLTSFRRLPLDLVKVSGFGLLLLIGVTYILKVPDMSRVFLLLFAALTVGTLAGGRLAVRAALRRSGRKDLQWRNIIVVGTDDKAIDFARIVCSNDKWGFRLLGLVSENRTGPYDPRAGEFDVIGSLDDLERICNARVVDEVIFVVPGKVVGDLEYVFLMCEELGVNTRVAVGMFPHLIARAALDELGQIPLLTFTTKPTSWFALGVKRVMDLGIAWMVLILGLPLWVLVAVAIKLDSKGPIFFCQERCGLNGRRFTMFKFRSMVRDAEARFSEVSSLNELSGPVFKARNDPRITRVGRIIRRMSIDEIPQLLNVIKGDMSIVGPRPPLQVEVDKYERWQRRRLSMKPGLTCLWAVRGRNRIPFERWMEMDLEYIDNWSLWLDVQILGRTIPAVLSGDGAN